LGVVNAPLAHVSGARVRARVCAHLGVLVCVCVIFFLILLSFIYVVFCMTFIDWYGFHLHVMCNTFKLEHLII